MPTSSNLPLNHYSSILEIDLKAIKENYTLLRLETLKNNPKARCGAAVKANAYGLGALPITKELESIGCRDFFVAYLDEALELKPHLKTLSQLYILHSLTSEMLDYAFRHRFLPTINNLHDAQIYQDFAQRIGAGLPCIIHIDTGMTRLGLSPEDFSTFLDQHSSQFSHLNIQMVMSHLSDAEKTDHEQNNIQLTRFSGCADLARTKFQSALFSLSNSSGIFLGPDFTFDVTRPGYAIYGGNPLLEMKNPMKAVVRLKSPILNIQRIQANTPVGYNGSFTSQRPSRIATISLGYADGLKRSLSNKACGFINSHQAPLVGNISMDLTMIDITDSAFDHVKIGDEVYLLNDQQTIEDIAFLAQTNGYEILTSLGRRFKKLYLT